MLPRLTVFFEIVLDLFAGFDIIVSVSGGDGDDLLACPFFRIVRLAESVCQVSFWFLGSSSRRLVAPVVSIGSNFSLGVILMFSLLSCLFLLLFLAAAVYFLSQLRDDPRSAIVGLVVLLGFLFLILILGGAPYDFPAIPSNYCRYIN